MTTNEFVKRTKIPRHRVYYMEQCGYIRPRKELRGEYYFREYSSADVEVARTIWKYVTQGFKWRVAYQKAVEADNGLETENAA